MPENWLGHWPRKLAGELARKLAWKICPEIGTENELENGPKIIQKKCWKMAREFTKKQPNGKTQIRKMARHAQPWRAITIQSRLWPAMASHGCPLLPRPWDIRTQHHPRPPNDPTPPKTRGHLGTHGHQKPAKFA